MASHTTTCVHAQFADSICTTDNSAKLFCCTSLTAPTASQPQVLHNTHDPGCHQLFQSSSLHTHGKSTATPLYCILVDIARPLPIMLVPQPRPIAAYRYPTATSTPVAIRLHKHCHHCKHQLDPHQDMLPWTLPQTASMSPPEFTCPLIQRA